MVFSLSEPPISNHSAWPSLGLVLAMAGVLCSTALVTTPATYAPTHSVALICLYVIGAAAMHGSVLAAHRFGSMFGFLQGFLVCAVCGWHVREHLRPAGTVPSFDDWRVFSGFIGLVFAASIVYVAASRAGAPRWSTRNIISGTMGAGGAFVVLLAGAVTSTNTLAWHLLQHNRLLSPIAYRLFVEDVNLVRRQLWSETEAPGASSPPANMVRHDASDVDQAPHLVFVLVDTLRHDAVGPATMPRFDEFAETAFRFDDVTANSSWTHPSVASFFTGLIPEEHGAVHGSRLDAENLTLAEVFRDRGYRTAAFVANTAVVRADQGFDQGFDEYYELHETGQAYARAETVTAAVRDWLRSPADGAPRFLYVHYLDPHTPYLNGGPLNPASHEEAVQQYEAELRYIDGHLVELLEEVGRALSGPRAVLVTSDHGEEFGEHGERGHGHSLYGEVTRIPAVLWTTGQNTAGSIPARLEARDFFDLLRSVSDGPSVDVPAWAESASRTTRYASLYNAHRNSTVDRLLRPKRANVVMRSILHDDRHLIWSGFGQTYELYDLTEDPAELHNIAGRRWETVDRLSQLMETSVTRWVAAPPESLSDETLERLRALGYVR